MLSSIYIEVTKKESFEETSSDMRLFKKAKNKNTACIIFYVDDLLIVANEESINNTVTTLQENVKKRISMVLIPT